MRVRLLRMLENLLAIGSACGLLLAIFWPGIAATARMTVGGIAVAVAGAAVAINRRVQRLDPLGAGRYVNPIEAATHELGAYLQPGERVIAAGIAERRSYFAGWIPEVNLLFASWGVFVTDRRLILAREHKPDGPKSTSIPIEHVRVERVRRRPLSRSVRIRWPNGSADLQFTSFFFRDGDSIVEAIAYAQGRAPL